MIAIFALSAPGQVEFRTDRKEWALLNPTLPSLPTEVSVYVSIPDYGEGAPPSPFLLVLLSHGTQDSFSFAVLSTMGAHNW